MPLPGATMNENVGAGSPVPHASGGPRPLRPSDTMFKEVIAALSRCAGEYGQRRFFVGDRGLFYGSPLP